jgi:hypothetical protein
LLTSIGLDTIKVSTLFANPFGRSMKGWIGPT